MPTPLLGLALPATGSLPGAWGNTVNDSITSLLDSAIAGTTTLSADNNVDLTYLNEEANQSRQAIIRWTASGTVTRYITAPNRSKTYVVINASSTQSIVLRAIGPTTGVTIDAGEKCVVAWSGSDFVKVSTSTAQTKIVVTPEQFGAVGNGSTNDRVALQAALDSGFDVFLSLGKTYLFSGASIKMTTNNQSIGGGGVLRPSGSINGLVVGGEGAVVVTAAGANLIVGKAYTIHTLGTTSQSDWNTIAGTSGVTYAAGDYFVAAVTGVGAGTGSAWLTCAGNELSLTFSSSTQTSSTSTNGYAVFVGNANRVKINKMLLNDAYGGLYVTKCNMISLEWMWGVIRGPGITWYGNSGVAATAPQRSDVFNINWCVLNHGLGQYGFNWDGNCHSLNVKELGLIGGQANGNGSGGGKGIIIQNTSGGDVPAIGRFEHLELDYINNSHGIAITTGLDFDITNPYINGTGVYNNGSYVGPAAAAFNGIYVGSTVQNEEVRVTGGKSNGNTGYGIRSDGGSILYAGNTQIVLNTLGDVYGYLYNKAPYQLVDTYYYNSIISNNAYTVYDSAASATAANSYSQYTRSSKQLGWTIDNVTAYKLTSTYNQSLVPMYIGNNGTNNAVLRMYGSTSGYVGFTVPVAAGSTTYTFPAAPINGNFLQTDSSGNLSWAPASGGGGGVATVTASLPVVSSGGTNPIISVNSSSASTASYLVQRDANGDFAGRYITATQFVAGANYYIGLSGADATIAFDATDYISYDRTNNQYNFQIGGSGVLASNATALQSFKPIRIQGSTSGYVGFAAQAVAGGTTYTWPSSPVNDYFLKTDGSGNLSWAAASGGGVTSFSTGSSGLTVNASTGAVSINGGQLAVGYGGTGATTSTGSGSVVLATSPTITTPVISGNTTVNNINLGTGSNAGLYTTVFGVASGSVLTSSSYGTTAIGYNALTASTDGPLNTAVGYAALKANTTGDSNTALGATSLFTNITGFQNTAVGAAALNKSTSSNNTSVGHQAGFNVTTGAQNTLIGKSAGAPISTSGNNTALGWYAAGGTTIGATNTAIGATALSGTTSTSAVDNTAVGYAALAALTSYNNSSSLGANTDVTGSNQVQLGNSSTTTYVYGTVQNRSDLRDKADIRDTQLGLEFINALRPVDYKWDARDDYKPPMPEDLTDKEAMAAWAEACDLSKITHDGSKKRSRYHHGLIAQEVKAVLDAQGIDFGGYQDHKVKDGQDVLTIGYDELIAPLIKAIQELTARVKELESK